MTFRRIHFVTDSTCDLPQSVIEKWPITVVPTYVNIGDQSFVDDGVQFDREDYYKRLHSLTPYPGTAAPSPGVARQKVDAAFEGADHLMIVAASPRTSTIFWFPAFVLYGSVTVPSLSGS